MSRDAREELLGITALLVGLFLGLTLLPWGATGDVGRGTGSLLWRAFGVGAALIPVLGVGWALAAFGRLGPLTWARTAALFAGLIVLVPFWIGILTGGVGGGGSGGRPWFTTAPQTWTLPQKLAGVIPGFLAATTRDLIGTAGGILFAVFALSALGIVTVGWHPLVALRAGKEGKGEGGRGKRGFAVETEGEEEAEGVLGPGKPRLAEGRARGRDRTTERRIARLPVRPAPATLPGALIPPIDLLNPPPSEDVDAGEEQLDEMGAKLIQTLQTFKVEASIAGRTTGPVVTQFEVAPAPGVKVGRIAALADDLALAMRAPSLRIVAPIPGKPAVGIEVPNPRPRIVRLRELFETETWLGATRTLPIALGRDLEGRAVITGLAKMPHLLIAGATGSGKSVCINSVITSLIYAHPPEELRMLMIDPKMVELSMYGLLPHLRHPVVTNYHKAATALKWAVREMDRRYELLHANHARNIADFNRKVREGKPLKGPRETLGTQAGLQTDLPFDAEYTEGVLPYIVLIVDELADLMVTVPGEIETPLATLAQKARAIGIHLILATQRPSVNVITGLIKANFSCRIAFRVSAKVDSRTILDQNGAETLLGNGDMLFLPPGKSELVRIQGAFISTDETERLMEWYRARAAAVAKPEPDIMEQMEAIEAAEEAEFRDQDGGAVGERDSLFRQAAEVCIQNQIGSTSLLQRRMSIGYGRAARIIDQLEAAGILGPANGSRPRDVLVGLEELQEICGEE